MSHSKTEAYSSAVCPFWKETVRERREVRCEGIFEDTDTRTSFNTLKNLERHMAKYCLRFECEHCKIYRAIMLSKYPDAIFPPETVQRSSGLLTEE